MTNHHQLRLPAPATLIAVLALMVAVFAVTIGNGQAEQPTATSAKALGTKHLKIRRAGVAIPANVAADGNYNSRTITVACAKGETALSVGTNFSDPDDNRELAVRYARLTVNSRGTPTGAIASGMSDTAATRAFEVQVLCAG